MEDILTSQSDAILQDLTLLRLLSPYLVQSLSQRVYLGWIIASGIFAFLVYGYDKVQAVRGGYRVPERLLHVLALAGGFVGCALGMTVSRHKIRKTRFKAVILLAFVVHGAILVSLLAV